MPASRFLNPSTVHAPTGYTHVVETTGPSRTIYVAGQIGIAPDGKVAGDFRAQCVQSF
jgi:enamine deaminase RidA (YjgF/YER057c/UK114 family)